MAAEPTTLTPTKAPELTLQDLRAHVHDDPPLTDGPTVELVGRKIDPFAVEKEQIAIDMAVAEALLPHQLHEIDQVIEMAHLKEMIGEKEARISFLTMGLEHWRTAAQLEAETRRTESAQAFTRERELVGILHEHIQRIDLLGQTIDEQAKTITVLTQTVDEQLGIIEVAQTNARQSSMRVMELEGRLDDLDEKLRAKSRRWWQKLG